MTRVSHIRRQFLRAYYMAAKVVCPGLRNSQFAYRDALEEVVRPTVSWLDLGCGHQLFPDWMPDSLASQTALVRRAARAVGVDAVDLRPHVAGLPKIAANIERLPFRSESFSLITANMVVEHVLNPSRLLSEINRVLVPGGLFLFHTPNANYFEVAIARRIPSAVMKVVARFLDGRGEDDIFPTHYRLNKASDIRDLASAAGLSQSYIRYVECTAQGVMLGPLVLLELLVIRMLRSPRFQPYRSDLVVALQKPQVATLPLAEVAVMTGSASGGG